MALQVIVTAISNERNMLEIMDGATRIGEYERSQDADVIRKKQEITNAESFLRDLFATYGALQVRWNNARGEKVVYNASGVEVGTIPKSCWETPSWREGGR